MGNPRETGVFLYAPMASPPDAGLLAIFAHPDDAELWCGGTILRHRAFGIPASIVCFDTGEAERREEAARAAHHLDATCTILPRRESWWRGCDADLDALLAGVLAVQPKAILTHCADDTHPEHVLVAQMAVKAAIRAQDILGTAIEVYESSSYHGQMRSGLFQPTVFIDVDDVWDRKLAALQEFHSQTPAELIRFADAQSRFYGGLSGTGRAEGFRRFPLLGLAAKPALVLAPFAEMRA